MNRFNIGLLTLIILIWAALNPIFSYLIDLDNNFNRGWKPINFHSYVA